MSAAIVQPIATQIVAVTVYRDRALVQRRGTVTWQDSHTVIEVAGLPAMLQPDSVRVGVASGITGGDTGGDTGEQVQICEVQVCPALPPKPEPGKLQPIRQEIQALQHQRQQTADQLSTLKLQQHFVTELGQSAIQPFAQALAQQQIDLSQTEAFLGFIANHHQSYASQITELEQTHQSFCDRIQILEQQLKDYSTPALAKGFRLLVHLIASQSGSCELELSYLVSQVSWEACYDLCLTPNHQVQLTCFGQVTQTSGEDWTNVAIQFSTAKPEEGNLPPAIAPWAIDIVSSATTAQPPELEMGVPIPYNMALAGAAGSELPSAMRRMQSQGQAVQKPDWQGIVCFPVANCCTVPSDGNSHKVVILQDQYPCQLTYLAQPKQVGFAYTHVQVTNPPSGLTLLPGKVNLFRGSTFVGSTAIAALAPGQSVDLNLGIDSQITLQRHQVQRDLEQNPNNHRQRLMLVYCISLTNHHNQALQITVQEPLPVSKNDQVGVHVTNINPPVDPSAIQNATGSKLLTWTVEVAAQSTQELTYQLTVDCPANLALTGCATNLSLTGLDS